jgi:hypothetical protein
VPGYLRETTRFSGVIEVVYDHAHKLRDPGKFIEDCVQFQPVIVDESPSLVHG